MQLSSTRAFKLRTCIAWKQTDFVEPTGKAGGEAMWVHCVSTLASDEVCNYSAVIELAALEARAMRTTTYLRRR